MAATTTNIIFSSSKGRWNWCKSAFFLPWFPLFTREENLFQKPPVDIHLIGQNWVMWPPHEYSLSKGKRIPLIDVDQLVLSRIVHGILGSLKHSEPGGCEVKTISIITLKSYWPVFIVWTFALMVQKQLVGKITAAQSSESRSPIY